MLYMSTTIQQDPKSGKLVAVTVNPMTGVKKTTRMSAPMTGTGIFSFLKKVAKGAIIIFKTVKKHKLGSKFLSAATRLLPGVSSDPRFQKIAAGVKQLGLGHPPCPHKVFLLSRRGGRIITSQSGEGFADLFKRVSKVSKKLFEKAKKTKAITRTLATFKEVQPKLAKSSVFKAIQKVATQAGVGSMRGRGVGSEFGVMSAKFINGVPVVRPRMQRF